MRIFIVEPDKERYEITDNVYWFQENYVEKFGDLTRGGHALHPGTVIEFTVDGKIVWDNRTKDKEIYEIDELVKGICHKCGWEGFFKTRDFPPHRPVCGNCGMVLTIFTKRQEERDLVADLLDFLIMNNILKHMAEPALEQYRKNKE